MVKIKLIDKIGEGGCASVHRCTVDGDSTYYALKRLDTPSIEQNERFQTELRILSILDHQNIVKVVLKLRIDCKAAYLMPLYKSSLENELINLAGNESKITLIFSAILDGVDYAHSQGVLHRDLKPLNVLMNNETEVVVSDFGLGRLVDSSATRKTVTGASLGSYVYTAPEQWDDLKSVDERADIYSLGKILHAMFLGHAPLNSNMRSVPAGFDFIINKCTDFDPERRFQKVSDLKTAWNSLLDATAYNTEIGELERLSAHLSAPSNIQDETEIDRFLELIVKHRDNEDIFYERVMEVNASCFAALYLKEPEVVRQLLKNFTEFVEVRSWPFSYTDRIADHCKQLFLSIEDYDIRAEIIKCLLHLGVRHNRWHVIGRLSELMQLSKNGVEALVIYDRLSSVDLGIRQKVANNLNVSRLHITLRPLFDFDTITISEVADSFPDI